MIMALQNEGYSQVEGAPAVHEGIPAQLLVGAAYGFIWLLVLLFLIRLWRRNDEVRKDLEVLRKKLDAAMPSGAEKPKEQAR